ncbi:hypothetical protein DB347_06595 [Opitutaceae bacterium EW11]|nr:hypothetical protein DB347_06595 [Opitutaceae bacterium EW11]
MISLRHPFLAPVLAAALALLPVSLHADTTAQRPKKEISDEVSSELTKLKEKVDAKDYAAAVKLLDGILAKAEPKSYDTAMVSQLKGQILLTEGKYQEAVGPLVAAQQLGEEYEFYEKPVRLNQLYLLCQLHYQLAAEAKSPERQAELFDQAYRYIRRWLDATPKPTPDAELFAASILYGHATLQAGKPDAELLRKARAEATNGLYCALKPPDQLYVLLLASMQQLNDHLGAADMLEMLVKKQPGNALYWQQLAGTYMALANEAKEDREIRRYQIRTILTMQRAQRNGHFTTPKDNLTVIGLYFNIEQYGRAADLLAEGLKSGAVENTQANWEMLALAYQQNAREADAIGTLEKAAALFPAEGQIELTLAQLHYGAGRVKDAHLHLQRAAAKGNLKKPGAAYLFLGFTAYETQNFDEAAKWADNAAQQPDVKADDARRLKRAALDAIKEREALKNTKI